MKNILLAAALSISALATGNNNASAQAGFTFTKLTQPYTPLTGATSLTKGALWTSDSTFTAPIGFNFQMEGTTINKVFLAAGNFAASTRRTAKESGFIMLGAGLMDRGQNWQTSRSDIRYQTTGNAGSRVFKLEVFNAGFEDEYHNNGELKDSISMQLWLFEGTNVAEFHYGSSMVSNFNDYFGGLMRCGYIRNVDTATVAVEKFYVVNGNATVATLDSTTSFMSVKGLTSVPTSGTVFRFAPKGNKTTGVEQVSAGTLAKVYPTQCTGTLQIEHNNTQPLSYSIISMTGQIVAHGTVNRGTNVIDIARLSSGTYTISIVDESSRTYEGQKIIKL